ncbi:MAG: PKD domain-containing protein [Taibaiella sp.]|nr:PKD domain-containing protein [Taibaiella sp.]
MQLRKLLSLLSFTVLFLLSATRTMAQVPDTVDVYGPDTVCQGYEYEYYVDPDSLPDGDTWWQINTNGTIVNVVANYTARVKWVSVGNGVLIFHKKDPSGSYTAYIGIKRVHILSLPQPFITTNFKVKCQKPGTTDTTDFQGFDTSECIRVCAYNCITYYAHGQPGSTYNWNVFGGSVSFQDADSCIICWDAPGSGYVTVEETTVHGCVGERSYCVEILESPIAHFVALPDTTQRNLNICDSTEVIFLDKSYASAGSPIMSWHWDFGDGSYSNAKGSLSAPVTHMYAGPGHYTVTLTVTNKCGCSTTETMEINVDANVRKKIECPRVVCENDTAVYSVNTSCSTATWTIIGGTVINSTFNSVMVKWDAVDPSGFGYVIFDETSCGQPCAVSTVKVPVVLSNGTIEGPTILCPYSNYIFKMPQWPTTTFNWSLNGGAMAYIMPTDQPNEVVIYTATAESLTLTCNYYNTMLGCSGTATLNIDVLDPVVLSGPQKVCLNTNGTFNLTGTNASTASWVLTEPSSGTQTGSGATFIGQFDEVGTYILTATGTFCPLSPYIIKVDPLPPTPDTIIGPDSFCLGVGKRFLGRNDAPGTIFNWAMDNGTVNAASGDETHAKMPLGSTGPYIIYLWRETREAPYCHSDTITKQVYPPTINQNITGNTTPCVSTHYAYQSSYDEGEQYEWRIVPQTMGSVRAGDGSQAVNVLWNNAPGTAYLICKMHKCFTDYIDTLVVNIGGQPSVVYSGPSPVCGDDSFTVSVTNATATFDFGDGTGFHTNGTGSFKYAYDGNADMTATLTINVTTACGLRYQYTPSPTIVVNPTPMGTVTPVAINSCNTVYDTLRYDHLVGNMALTPFTYQWYKDGVAISGATNNEYIVTTFGNYWIEVTSNAPDLCTWKSDTVKVRDICPCAAPGFGYITSGTVSDCNEMNFTATYSTTDFQFAVWELLSTKTAYITTQNYSSATAIATAPGYYTIKYTAHYEDTLGNKCTFEDFKTVVVRYVPILNYGFTCADSAGYREVVLKTGVTVFPGSNYNHEFFVDNVLVQNSTQSTWTGYLSPGVHTAKLRSSYNGDTCEAIADFTVVWVDAAFTFERDTTCEEEAAVQFTNASLSYTSSHWYFGDGTENTQDNPARVYNTPGSKVVKLVVTDASGCKDSVTHSVVIWPDSLQGTLSVTPKFLCPNGGLTFDYIPNLGTIQPETYYWYLDRGIAGVTNFEPWVIGAVTGMWWMHGENRFGCVVNTNADTTEVTNVPRPFITGDADACVNVPYNLNGYAGSDPNINYRWMLNGVVMSPAQTNPTLTQTNSSSGTYTYRLIIDVFSTGASTWCTDTSQPFVVTVHPKPAAPVATFNITDCNKYEVELNGSHTSGSTQTFNWSNGLTGTQVYTYSGGPYNLEFTDQYGCKSDVSIFVPKDPREYLWIFPTGCWSICPPQHYTITGPIIRFTQWDYLKNGGSVHGGSNSKPTDYLTLGTDAPGIFNLYLDNGYCNVTSGDMIVDTNCTPITWAGKPGRLNTEAIESRLKPALNLVPNPAENGTKLVYTFTRFESEKRIEVYDVTGRLMVSLLADGIQGNTWLSLDRFTPGIYQVVLKQDGNVLLHEKLSVIK